MRYFSYGLIVAALSLSACADDTPRNSVPADTASADIVSADTASVDTVASDMSAATRTDSLEWTTETIHVDHSIREIAVVDELRTGRHQPYDRFVIEFQNDVIPGYHVSYLDEQPIECGSGEPINVAGDAALELRLEAARGHNEQGQSTVDHGERQFDLPLLQEAEVSCDFEAMFTVVLGLQERVPYRVTELQDPARLVVDLRHASNQELTP